ncbi:T9SS type A sorting domain-containing protein [bacterium]|nr:T9SS type A sorting domain-containing protein [bacterium]
MRRVTLKQKAENNQWINQSKSVFDYDVSNKLNRMEHYEWRNDQWENDVAITYTYNSNAQLEGREERIASTGELLSFEIYHYDSEGRLVQITFPEVPWYQGRGLFGVRGNIDICILDPFLLVSHMKSIGYTYNNSGNLKNIIYTVISDAIPDSIYFFSNNSSKLHPLNTVTIPIDLYETTINSYGNSIKIVNPPDLFSNTAIISGTYSYITNGNQISVIYNHPYHLNYGPYHRLFHLYEIWYPNKMRNIWIYSTDTDSDFTSSPKTGHINPQQEISPFKDRLTFWLIKYFKDDQQSLPIQYFGNYDNIDQGYYSSKIEKSLTLSNYYIPGNYYDYFYEPRYQGSYPVQNRKVLKTIEQSRLHMTKLNSPIFYGIGWDYQDDWVNYIERDYEYDTSGRLEKNILKRWEWKNNNPNSGWWENDSQYAFLYDGEGNCIQINCNIWDSESNEWHDHFRTLYTYEDSLDTDQQQNPAPIELTNYPNPFNASTHIRFLLTQPSKVSLKVYDITGRLIQTILSEEQLTGQRYIYEWDGKDNEGNGVPSGMYLFHLTVGDNQTIKKCLFVK